MLTCYHDSQHTQYRKPTGAVTAGTAVTLSIRVQKNTVGGFHEIPEDMTCTLHLWLNRRGGRRLPMERTITEAGSCFFTLSVTPGEEPDLCWYYFILEYEGRTFYYGNNSQQLGGEGQVYDYEPPAFQITVYKPAEVPSWYKNAIVYQIFPDRFARSDDWLQRQMEADPGDEWKGPRRVVQQNWNDIPYYTRNEKGEITRWPFFGGTLQGIRSKLFYLKSLGVGAIYLNPIFKAASNHKYDTADYMEIDPSFGTLEDFNLLAKDAQQVGIKLILDGVFNHTGADSVYFNKFGNYPKAGACQGPHSPYYNWYKFKRFPDDYDCWWGVKDLPDMEEMDPTYQEFIYGGKNSVIRKWLREGASGWRLDVADELPDEFIEGIRKALKETDPDGLLLGEVWEDASNKVSYDVQRRYLLGDELDSTMNYPVRELLTDFMLGKSTAENAVKKLRSLAENYPPENFYGALNLIGSHDRMRILTMLGDAPSNLSDIEKENYKLPEDRLTLAKSRLKLLSLLQYVIPGVPCLYYGDEAGMQGFEDPYNRGTYPWGKEDEDLLSHYRTLATLRKQYDMLTTGAYSFFCMGDDVLVCHRFPAASPEDNKTSSEATENIITIINRNTSEDADITLMLPKGTTYILELLTAEESVPDIADANHENIPMKLCIPPLSAKVLYCTSKPQKKLKLERSAGILMHVSSLSSGRLDDQAEYFVDFLEDSGQKLWQILPLNPVDSLSGSPYSSPAVFAGNPDFITGMLTSIDWDSYDDFCEREAYWLEDYALYTVIKDRYKGAPWQEWPDAERNRKNLDLWREDKKDAIELIKHRQFAFHMRWQQVKKYANEKGISIIGDIPVYVAADSADTWAHREVFMLDEYGYQTVDAGVPPDFFSEDGQHWGNPLYNWDHLKATDYQWWAERVRKAMQDYDYIRLDHFRSFAAFFAIPFGKKPCDGWWQPGIGKNLFDFLTDKFGPIPFLAEDLGVLDEAVYGLMKYTGYPGMNVYQFTAEEMEEMSETEASTRIFYSGTHDNQTLESWCDDTSCEKTPNEIIKTLYESKAPWVIIPLQDVLGLDDKSRMNIPGKADGNWKWRVKTSMLSSEVSEKLKYLATETKR